jgi:Ulp1 family protease
MKLRKLEPKWATPLLYPFEGPKRQIVDYEDLDRLKSEEYLNDNLINFYLRLCTLPISSYPVTANRFKDISKSNSTNAIPSWQKKPTF